MTTNRDPRRLRVRRDAKLWRMNTAKKICESDEQDPQRPPQDETARRARLQRYTTWTEDDLREFQAGLAAQRVIDPKL